MSRRVRAHRAVRPEILEFDPALVLRLAGRSAKEYFAEQPDGGRRILRAIRQLWYTELTVTQKKYLLLYYQNAVPMREIAARYDVTVSTVSRTLKRARERLRQVLQFYL